MSRGASRSAGLLYRSTVDDLTELGRVLRFVSLAASGSNGQFVVTNDRRADAVRMLVVGAERVVV